MTSTVSIVTITQKSRQKSILNLCEFINNQTYSNLLLEWVIVEGSNNKEDAEENKIFIKKELFKKSNLPVTYMEYYKNGLKLSDLRNIGNEICKRDIIVCMDDDDYYPPTRVEDVVSRLTNSDKQIAGCSDVYLYNYNKDKLYKFKSFGENHSTNNCLAYKKEYLLNHEYAEGLECSEEMSFTNNFTEPMVQLDADKCIVVSGHMTNTFDKTPLCVKENKQIREILNEENNIISRELILQIKEAVM